MYYRAAEREIKYESRIELNELPLKQHPRKISFLHRRGNFIPPFKQIPARRNICCRVPGVPLRNYLSYDNTVKSYIK